MKTAFRWIFVLPGACAAAFLCQFTAGFIPGDYPYAGYLTGALRSVFSPAVFIMVGLEIAPRFRQEMCVTLTAVWIAAVAFLVGYHHLVDLSDVSGVWVAIYAGLTIAGAAVTCIVYWRAEDQRRILARARNCAAKSTGVNNG